MSCIASLKSADSFRCLVFERLAFEQCLTRLLCVKCLFLSDCSFDQTPKGRCEMSKALSIDTITRGAFWMAFAAFLCASIPHIAYFFRSFDPIGGPEDRYWWAIAYAIAIGIDMTDFLLSMNVARLSRNKASWRVLINRWLFIIGITSFSWFVNWEYNVQFSSTMLSKVDEVSLFGLLRVGDLNPVLASMFQVLSS